MRHPPDYGSPVYQQWLDRRLCNVYKDPYAEDEYSYFVDWCHPIKTASQDAAEQQLQLDEHMEDTADCQQVCTFGLLLGITKPALCTLSCIILLIEIVVIYRW